MKTSPSLRGSDAHRYLLSFVLSALLYAAVGYGLYLLSSDVLKVHTTTRKTKTLHLALSQFASPLQTVQSSEKRVAETSSELSETTETEKTPPVTNEPKPAPSTPIKREELPQKTQSPSSEKPTAVREIPKPMLPTVNKTAEAPKKTPQKVSHKKRRKKIKTTARKRIKKHKKREKKGRKKAKRQSRKRVAGGSRHTASAAQTQAFLATLRKRIERGKRYPAMAKRRGLQGSVRVRFVVTASGQVKNLHMEGSRLFFRSAKAAVLQAFPVSTVGANVAFPLRVSLTLRYRLR